MAPRLPSLHGLVMTGGYSTRMGQDKALIRYGEMPQLLAAFSLLQPQVAACFVSMREDQRADPARHALPAIVDTTHGIGPAAGLLAAHAAHPEAAWLVLACDLPLLQPSALSALVNARDGEHAAIAYGSAEDDFREPLCTLWEPEALRVLTRQAGEGRYGLRAALAQVPTLLLPAPADGSLLNINTPQERADLAFLPPPLKMGD